MSERDADRMKKRLNMANARAARPAHYRRKNREYQQAWRNRQNAKKSV